MLRCSIKSAGEIKGSLAGWLHRVATRKSIDMIRKDSARSKCEKTYVKTVKKEFNEWQELSPYVDQALEELDDNTREMLIRHYLGGKSMRLVAEAMGVSQPTVSRKIEKGVSQLRGILQKKGFIVSITALGGMLLTNAVEAAPAIIINELGKMAITGTVAAGTVAATGTSATVTAAGAKATGIGIAAGIKAKVITAVVVAAVSTGTVVTYNHVNKPTEPKPTSHNIVETSQRSVATPMVVNNDMALEQEWNDFLDELEREEAADRLRSKRIEADVYYDDVVQIIETSTDEPYEPFVPRFESGITLPVATITAKSNDPNDPEEATPPTGGGMYGGGFGGFGGGSRGGYGGGLRRE